MCRRKQGFRTRKSGSTLCRTVLFEQCEEVEVVEEVEEVGCHRVVLVTLGSLSV